jgi:hypothetical protein
MKLVKIGKQDTRRMKKKVNHISTREQKFRKADIQGDPTLRELCSEPETPQRDQFKDLIFEQQKELLTFVVKELEKMFKTAEFRMALKEMISKKR